MKKLLLNLIVLGILLGCSNVNATTNKSKFDAKEVARIQEIDRLRGKALTEKLIEKNIDKEKDKVKEKGKVKEKDESNRALSNGSSENIKSESDTSNQVASNGSNNTETPASTPPSNNGTSNNAETPAPKPPSNNNSSSNNTQAPPTTPPVQPQELKPVNPAQVGNSGMLFNTSAEADSWAWNQIENNYDSLCERLGFEVIGFSEVHVQMNDDSARVSIDFY